MSFSVRIPAKRKYTLWERIQEAVSCFESDGVSISMASISKFDSAIYVISDIIEIEEFPYNDEKKRSQVRKALRRFNSYSIKKLDYFLRALNTELRRAKKQPRQKFSIVFPLNMHINSFQHKRWIELLDYRLRFYPEQAVAKKFSLEDAKRDVGHHVAGKLPDYSRFVHIVIDAEAASPWEAFVDADNTVELFRAITNLIRTYGRSRWEFGRPSPRSPVTPSQHIYVFDETGSYRTWLGKLAEKPRRHETYDSKALEDIIRICRRINSIKVDTLQDILVEGIILYNEAMDQVIPANAFLHLWQTLEILVLKDESMTEKEVCKRVKAVFGKHPLLSDLLDALYRKRNLLVHEGKMGIINEDDINALKIYPERLIRFLISKASSFDNKAELDFYYRKRGSQLPQLSMERRILQRIERLYRTSSP